MVPRLLSTGSSEDAGNKHRISDNTLVLMKQQDLEYRQVMQLKFSEYDSVVVIYD